MKSVLFTIALLCSACIVSYAQSGHYPTFDHSPESGKDNVYHDILIEPTGDILLASRNGLIRYDGKHTSIVDVGGAVYDIELLDEGKLYMVTSVGVKELHVAHGENSMSEVTADDHGDIMQLVVHGDVLYGLTEQGIVNLRTSEFISDKLAGRTYFAYMVDGEVYVSTENKGTLKVTDGKLESVTEGVLGNEVIVANAYNHTTNNTALLTLDGDLYLHSSEGDRKVEGDFFSEISDALPSTVQWLDEKRLVIGTLTAGVFFVDVSEGEVLDHIQYGNGLKDNEVSALAVDKNKGVMIITPTSVAYVMPDLGVRDYAHYPGLAGDIRSVVWYQNHLYVGTNVGLYRLEQVKEYEQRVFYKNRVLRSKNETASPVVSKKKGFLGIKLRNKKKEEQALQDENIPSQEVVVKQRVVTNQVKEVYYEYKQIAKDEILHVTNMIPAGGQLLVAGLSGIYALDGKSHITISESPARYSFLSNDGRLLFECTEDSQVLTYRKLGDEWGFVDILTDFRTPIDHIIQEDNDYWMSSPQTIYKMTITGNELDDVEEYQLNNPYNSLVYGAEEAGQLYFYTENEKYQLGNGEVTTVDQETTWYDLLLSSDNSVWMLSDGWKKAGAQEISNAIFKMFTNISNINESHDQYWITTDEGQVLSFDKSGQIEESAYAPFVHEVMYGSERIISSNFKVNQEQGELVFEISQPDYAHLLQTKYRYRLDGLNQEWTDWNHNEHISFPFIPAGSYTLDVEAENSLGNVYQLDPVSFKVLPPYWKRPLFYVFEGSVVLCLFLLSIKLKSWGYKYRLVSRLLAFLTLVIIVEGLEAIMESYFEIDNSPVFSFSLQVLMAMIILPFEGILKKYVFREDISLKSYFELKGKKHFEDK